MADAYLTNLVYRGECGIFVTLRYQRRVRDRFGRAPRRQASRWWFTRPGWLGTECGPFRTKFDALLAAAHGSLMSGRRANLLPMKEDDDGR